MQRTDTYYKEEQFQGFISEGQNPLYLISNDCISFISIPVAIDSFKVFFTQSPTLSYSYQWVSSWCFIILLQHPVFTNL